MKQVKGNTCDECEGVTYNAKTPDRSYMRVPKRKNIGKHRKMSELSRTCSRGVWTYLRVQGLKGRVQQVAINYPSVACVLECENEVTRKVYKVS